ncbi:MAG: DUF3343 domain-containing protein [Armatimonadota bacterium]
MSQEAEARALLIYPKTCEAIRAERVLRHAGHQVRVVGPPPEFRKGCDLAVEFREDEREAVSALVEDKRVPPLEIVPLAEGTLEPTEIVSQTDFGEYLMVRAGNMKLVIRKDTREIVNVSGGGCPDVPYVASEMIGRSLEEAPSPRDVGYTLCAYALALAHDRLLAGGSD